MKNIFKGLGIALVTPFCENGDVDYDALKQIVSYQIENGADFLCILATTGEVPTLTDEEKQQIKELIVSTVAGRVPILIGCGGNNTYAVCHELKTADFTGIDGVLSICPYYNKPTQEGLFQHFKAISEASPLPIILYNVPARTGVNLAAETTCRLARECDNIVCIKEASGNIEQIVKILHDKPEDFDVISGDDGLTLQITKEGGVGVISVIGNAYTKLYSQFVHHATEGRFAEAEAIDTKLKDLYRLLFVDGNPAGIKALMANMGLLSNVLRLPLVPARSETQQQIIEVMKIQDC
ncbi:MAG: 4-hydroxy-tetrahydrodipicolinate synthase [Prevotellaceae bacterium]|nr:4-hydroxy-tetrahydrodipicolinate synthase [Prevotellaceae bacterium]